MKALPLIPDNICEVLVKIIQFTDLRRRILHDNLHHVDAPCFTPRDLPVREFADALNEAVAEHLQHHRLLLRDTAGIRFGPGNVMQVQPQIDTYAQTLLRTNRNEYMELQINKLLENALNRKVAEELLRQKSGVYAPGGVDFSQASVNPSPFEGLPTHGETSE